MTQKSLLGVAALVLLVIMAINFRRLGSIFSPSVSPAPANVPASSVPKSAFTPEPPSASRPQIQEPKWEPTPPAKTTKSAPPTTVEIPSLDEIGKRVSEAIKENRAFENRLALPDIPDAEIAFDPNGLKTVGDFLTYFSAHIKEVKFNSQRFGSVLQNKEGIPFLPYDLIEKGLQEKDFKKVHDSLSVYRDMTDGKIAYLSSIKVSGDAAVTLKDFIGLERLTVELIDKAFKVENGALPAAELGQFFEKVKATAMSENADLLVRTGIARKDKNLFDRAFDVVQKILGPKNAAAQALVFGGAISIIEPPGVCACEPGFLLSVGPPAPTVLFVSVAWMATPALFLHRSVRPGAYWLGSYSGAPGVCEAVPYCEPVGLGFRPTIAGTSL